MEKGMRAGFSTGYPGLDNTVQYFAEQNLITIASTQPYLASLLATNIFSDAVFRQELYGSYFLPKGNRGRFDDRLTRCSLGLRLDSEGRAKLSPPDEKRLRDYTRARLRMEGRELNIAHASRLEDFEYYMESSLADSDLVVVDSIQNFDFAPTGEQYGWSGYDDEDGGPTRADQIALTSRTLKQTAAHLRSTVMVTVPLNLDGSDDSAEGLLAYDFLLRDSDVVFEVEPTGGTRVNVRVQKNRWGPDKTNVPMEHHEAICQLYDPTPARSDSGRWPQY
ncbi:hypothetical protein [Haloglycomyces albus]|uniref:hypothetical protein n=1 Tax=Haloglycomyces albus TaxID=526067 RepID=UPI0004B1B13E|nr:hypothetical protein [Haloglycomyces albus]